MTNQGIHIAMLAILLSFIQATETAAQKNDLSEIHVEVEHQKGDLQDLVLELEGNTGFTFAYLDQSLQNKEIILNQSSWQMDDLLREISLQARVSLKRVNETIAIINEKDEVPTHLAEENNRQWSINGSVLGEGDAGMAFANVLLLNASDSSIAKGAVTDEQGSYSITHVGPGNYLIQCYTVGFLKNNSPVFQVNDGDIVLNPIRLNESIKELDGVVIQAEKPLFEQKIDRLIVNVQNSPIMVGSTAIVVLSMTPGVTVTPANIISINGKSGVMLMINGKLNRMSGQALVNYLESTPAENIERIELISTPPARYDAEGNAGFINIELKKDDKVGMKGSVNIMAGHGRKEKFLASATINSRTQKLNVFSSLTYNRDQVMFYNDLIREVRKPEYQLISTSKINRIGGIDLISTRMGVDYYLSAKTTLGVLGDFFIRDYKAHLNAYSYNDYKPGVDTLSGSLRRNLDTRIQSLINFNIHHQVDTKQSIEINIDYLDFRNKQNDRYDNEFIPQNGELLLTEEILVTRDFPVRFWVGAIDYQLQINDRIFMETGIKTTMNKLTNDVSTKRLSEEVFVNDPNFTFFTDMHEDILAAYGSINASLDKITFKSGLRYEHTHTIISNSAELPQVKRSYGNFFPNVFISRKLTEKSSINASYISRVSRPTFYQLSPGQKFMEPRLFRTGNTQLLPSRIHAFQSSWTWNSFITSIEYNRIDDDIGNIPIQEDNSNVVVLSNVNFDKTELIGIRFSIPVIINDWWEMNNNMGLYSKKVSSSYISETQQMSINYGIGYSTQRFKIGHGLSAELSGSYHSGNISGVTKVRSYGAIAVGLSKKLGNAGGTLNLSISDILRTTNNRFETYVPKSNLIVKNAIDYDRRVFRITYTNTFGNTKIKSRSMRKGSSEEELKRL